MTACRYVARDQPRVIPGEHFDTCHTDDCRGCWPCPERHCGSCSRRHATHDYPITCVDCLSNVRDNLDTIASMAGLIRDEADQRATGNAAMLVGPTANPEAWRYRALSAMRGRIDDRWLDDCQDERHPLWVLGTWSDLWREHLDQTTAKRVTIGRAWRYLNIHLTRMAQQDEPDFAQFATEVGECCAFMLGVIRDQPQGDVANVNCFDCGGKLERKLKDRRNGGPDDDRGGFEDQWTCRRCQRKYTYAEYNFALRAALEEPA